MAVRTIGNLGGNWKTAGTWVEGVVPTNADDVVATGTSGQLTVNGTDCVCKTIDLTGYAALMTFTAGQVLTVSGNVKFASTHTLAGTGTLTVNAASNLTAGTQTFPGSLITSGAFTFAFQDNWHITGSATQNTGTGVWNGFQIQIDGSLTATTAISGTTLIVMGGTGTISTATSTVAVSNSITINTAGTITFGTSFAYVTGTFTWVSGTLSGTASTVLWTRGSSTFDLKGTAIPSFAFYIGSTITMLSNFKATYLSICAAAVFSGNYDIECDYFELNDTKTNGNQTLTYPYGRLLKINTGASLCGNLTHVYLFATIKSGTPGNSASLIYLGDPSLWRCSQMIFTDIDTTGSIMSPMPNYWGGTLTRCTGIVNLNLPVTTVR